MGWRIGDQDRQIFERELAAFVPPRIFDTHAHLYEKSQFHGAPPAIVASGPDSVGWETYREHIAQILPGRKVSALFFGFPDPKLNMPAANDFLIHEARRDANSRGQMLVTPEMDPEFIRGTVRREKFAGLKCYHCYATEKPTFEAAIPSYLPEEQVKVAHEEGLSITLHMVKRRAIADPSNQKTIRAYAERYPNARLILAHTARGFNPYHVIEGIGALRGLRNIWCDTAAVTEAGGFEAIARTLGVDRLLYGSDFPISHDCGRCVALGDSFHWISPENTKFDAAYAEVGPVSIGTESLRALKVACLNLGLSDSQVEAIFYGNAAELFGLKK